MSLRVREKNGRKFCPIKACIVCAGELVKKRHQILGLDSEEGCDSHRNHYCVTCMRDIQEKQLSCGLRCTKRKDDPRWGDYCGICQSLAWALMEYDRNQRKEEEIRKEKCRMPSLLELCVKTVVKEPNAILFLSQQNLPEKTWELIESYIPDKITEDFLENLVESQKEGGRSMFRALGKLFSRYYKRGRSFKTVDCGEKDGKPKKRSKRRVAQEDEKE